MITDKETQQKISDLGLDFSELSAAITSTEEVSLEVPTIDKEKQFTKTEMTTFGNNRFGEGKTAMDEMRAKGYKEKYSIDIEGKDLDSVIEAFGNKRFSEAKPDGDTKELLGNFTALQGKYTVLEKALSDKDAAHKNDLFQTGIVQTLINKAPKELGIPADKAVKLYLMDNKIKKENGSAVVLDSNGEIQKDNLLNPIEVDNHFSSWLDSSGLITKSGMAGKDSKGGSTGSKFSNISEFTDWCYANGKEPMSEAMQKYYQANKAS